MGQKYGPVHYIEQPAFHVGTGKMQKNFVARKDKRSAAFDVNGQEVVEHFDSIVDPAKQADNNQLKGQNQVGQKKEKATPNEKKSFKEMSVEERIIFLLHRPFYIPASPCEIQAQGQSHFGFIEAYDGTEIVLAHLTQQEKIIILRCEITDILLLRM